MPAERRTRRKTIYGETCEKAMRVLEEGLVEMENDEDYQDHEYSTEHKSQFLVGLIQILKTQVNW